MKTTDRISVQLLAKLLKAKGVDRVVISPGSRNAPLTIAFTCYEGFASYAIPDERSAGFIALGMALQEEKPVALVCTSGTALLNYYPAIAEAFYQQVPLVVISADRPGFLIDQGDGQTIRQRDVFANHIRASIELKEHLASPEEKREHIRRINEAMNTALSCIKGPVHINFPFDEPLYNTSADQVDAPGLIRVAETSIKLSDNELHRLKTIWNESERIIVLAGQQTIAPQFRQLMKQYAEKVLIMSEVTSNLSSEVFFTTIDRFLVPLSKQERKQLQPDLLVTFGGAIVSKKIKQYFREYQPKQHWHIGHRNHHPDTFFALTDIIPVEPEKFFNQLLPFIEDRENNWLDSMRQLNMRSRENHNKFMDEVPFCDLRVFSVLSERINPGQVVHLANSTPVRYAQLFNWKNGIVFFGNRGTSGIDGCVSTAVGTAIATQQTVWLITGDMAFFYDSNGLWHRHHPKKLKIVVINNGGGGIFRFIDGPESTGVLEDFFETRQPNSVQKIAESFGLHYKSARNEDELRLALNSLCEFTDESTVLEVFTPREINAEVLKKYFQSLN